MSTIRSFLAIDLPQEIRDNLGEVQHRLKTPGSQVKWVRPESIHLTLKFFGNIEEKEIDALSRATESAASHFHPFHVEVTGVGVFPNISRPRVIWAGVEFKEGTLNALHKDLDTRFDLLGFEREKRRFTPHLTLGRVKSLWEKRRLTERIETLRAHRIGSFNVESLFLFRSDLHPTGAVYTKLKTLHLNKS